MSKISVKNTIISYSWLSMWAFLGVFCWLYSASSVAAAPVSNDKCNAGDRAIYFSIQPWDAYLPCKPGVGVYFDSLQSLGGLLFWAIDTMLKLAAYIAVGFVIWGSIKYIKAQGEPSELNAAKTTIMNALIGLAICIASVAIVNTVAEGFF